VAGTRLNATEKPIKPGRIAAVLTTLGREIAQDLIPVGAALPPGTELEARFGVGRGVVREVVKTLAAKGLVNVRPRHGTHVLPRNQWSLLDRDVLGWLKSTFDVNAHIEPKYILKVMKDHPELFSDLPPIPDGVAIGSGYVLKP
jgi:DNA-binding FadR family transcriptional regulator